MTEENERRRRFEVEVFRLMDRLYGRALRLTANPADAEDLVADAVSRAWAKLDELRDPQCFEAWLFRILTNVFISAWRQRGISESEVSAQAEDSREFSLFEQLHQPFLLWWGSPEHEFLNNLLREDLEKALDSLPDEFRVAVVLVMIEGYTYAEAAELLEVPIGTVRSRLNRGRGLLQRALWEQAKETGLEMDKSSKRNICQHNHP
jgi:RNA polymerase sigma factor (sigma-70 family)